MIAMRKKMTEVLIRIAQSFILIFAGKWMSDYYKGKLSLSPEGEKKRKNMSNSSHTLLRLLSVFILLSGILMFIVSFIKMLTILF